MSALVPLKEVYQEVLGTATKRADFAVSRIEVSEYPTKVTSALTDLKPSQWTWHPSTLLIQCAPDPLGCVFEGDIVSRTQDADEIKSRVERVETIYKDLPFKPCRVAAQHEHPVANEIHSHFVCAGIPWRKMERIVDDLIEVAREAEKRVLLEKINCEKRGGYWNEDKKVCVVV